MEVYDRVIKIVAPKRAKLQEAEVELSRQMKRLSEKHTQLQQVRQFLNEYYIQKIASLKYIHVNDNFKIKIL
jgi:prefoldin subunit 5